MSNPGPIDQNRDLLADLKQDEQNAKANSESEATQEHIAGAQGKLASAISQHQGDSDISEGAQRILKEVEPSGGDVDRDAVQQSLYDRAKTKIDGNEMNIDKGSEAARLQSAAEKYQLAMDGQKSQPESWVDKE